MTCKIVCWDCGFAVDPRENDEQCPNCGNDYTEERNQ